MVEWVRSLFGKGNKRKRGHIRINAEGMNPKTGLKFFDIYFYPIKWDFIIFNDKLDGSKINQPLLL